MCMYAFVLYYAFDIECIVVLSFACCESDTPYRRARGCFSRSTSLITTEASLAHTLMCLKVVLFPSSFLPFYMRCGLDTHEILLLEVLKAFRSRTVASTCRRIHPTQCCTGHALTLLMYDFKRAVKVDFPFPRLVRITQEKSASRITSIAL